MSIFVFELKFSPSLFLLLLSETNSIDWDDCVTTLGIVHGELHELLFKVGVKAGESTSSILVAVATVANSISLLLPSLLINKLFTSPLLFKLAAF
jgi:hypothetical protein